MLIAMKGYYGLNIYQLVIENIFLESFLSSNWNMLYATYWGTPQNVLGHGEDKAFGLGRIHVLVQGPL